MVFSPSLSVLTSVFRGEEFLGRFLRNLEDQTIFPEVELVLVMNEPSSVEKKLANDFHIRYPHRVQVLSQSKVEPLGASWNRAWLTARAPYIAIWNVDDRRNVDSLQRQLASLEQDKGAMLSYGDYIAVNEYGIETGVRRLTPAYNSNQFIRSFAQGGAFWVMRKILSETAGQFDEQFNVGVDMEYSFRLAAKGLEMRRCSGILGYFTNSSQGLSTREGGSDAAIERTAIQLRYGVFDKIRLPLAEKVGSYRSDAVKSASEWIPITTYLPDYESWLKQKEYLWTIGGIRNKTRNFLERTGLLSLVYNLQDRLWKREI